MANEMRDRLVELLENKYDHYCDQCGVNKESQYIENLADYLIENGVVCPPCKVGDEIWVVETECGEAVDVTCYIFLAQSKGFVIATPQVNDYDIDEIIEYHIDETEDNLETSLVVFPDELCFPTEEQAEQKLKEMRGE